jgi:hypothetical protein
VILFHTLYQQIWTICMLAVCALAFWRGGWPEQVASTAMVVGSLASGLLQNRRDWAGTQWADLAIDGIYLALMIWLAMRSNRFWPLWAAAFQLLSVGIYLARMADKRVGAQAPYVATVIWGYLILLAILWGIVGSWRARPRAAAR